MFLFLFFFKFLLFFRYFFCLLHFHLFLLLLFKFYNLRGKLSHYFRDIRPSPWILTQEQYNQLPQLRRVLIRKLPWVFMNDIIPQSYQVRPFKWWVQCSQVVQHAANCPDINFKIIRLMFYNFWGQVKGGADSCGLQFC